MKRYIKPMAKQMTIDACQMICESLPVGDPLKDGIYGAETKKQGEGWDVLCGEDEW
ncbi:MAG: hypothetical protein MJY90_00660 [Bacteroidaceae bacterium]|nr:hypothetical protein [Bacteroidaceae bacterium]